MQFNDVLMQFSIIYCVFNIVFNTIYIWMNGFLLVTSVKKKCKSYNWYFLISFDSAYDYKLGHQGHEVAYINDQITLKYTTYLTWISCPIGQLLMDISMIFVKLPLVGSLC